MSKHAEVSRSLLIHAPAAVLFDGSLLDVDFLAHGVQRHGPVPGVTRTEVVGADAPEVGAIRRAFLEDGAVLDEEIIALERPRLFVYRQMKGFGFPFSLLVSGGVGRYELEEEGAGTRFTWSARFDLRPGPTRTLTELILARYLGPLMDDFLCEVKDRFEHAASSS